MVKTSGYLYNSREALLPMASDEPIYEDPEITSRQPPSGMINQHYYATERPPVIYPKRKNVVAYNTNNPQVTLHPDFAQISNQNTWNPSRNVYPDSDGSHIAGIKRKPNNLGASMPNVNHIMANEHTKNDGSRKNDKYATEPESRRSPISREKNKSKGGSCCNGCCFFLLYVLIAGCAAVFVLHVLYPEILDPDHIKRSEIVDDIKKEYSIIRKLLRAYCLDYLEMQDQTYKQFAKMCAKKFNKTVEDSD